jgi:hypothetical protein
MLCEQDWGVTQQPLFHYYSYFAKCDVELLFRGMVQANQPWNSATILVCWTRKDNEPKKSSASTRHAGAWGERMYSSYSFTTSALDGGEWSASRPGRALPPGKGPPVPIVQEAGWAPEPVWTHRLEEKSFAPAGDRTPIARSSSQNKREKTRNVVNINLLKGVMLNCLWSTVFEPNLNNSDMTTQLMTWPELPQSSALQSRVLLNMHSQAQVTDTLITRESWHAHCRNSAHPGTARSWRVG